MGKISRALEKSQEGYEPEVAEKSSDGGQPSIKKEYRTSKEPEHILLPESKFTKNSQWDERLLKVTGFSSVLSETFRVLRTRILHPLDDEKKIKTILVTSAVPEEGKSFISANLAISLARGMDQYCLIVDCDLRRPSLAGLFGMGNGPGLSDYLQSKCDVPQIIRKTSVDKMTLLSSGDPPVNPSELLGSVHMKGLVQELSSRYEDRVIIFDSPPFHVASETSILAKQVDGVVVVIRWGAPSREIVRKLIDDIGKEKIVGIVFNGYKSNIVESKIIKYSNYYHYGYASKYSKSEE